MKKYESIKSKILKLHELALRGEHEEAKNAQRHLDNMLSKYNLSLDRILEEDNLKKEKYFIVNTFFCNLFFQCVFQVLNLSKIKYKEPKKGHYYIEMTELEYAELISLFEWHKQNYKIEYNKMVKSFFSAYIQKHEIWDKEEPTDEELEYRDNKKIDYEELKRIIGLQNSMSDKKYVKMIGE